MKVRGGASPAAYTLEPVVRKPGHKLVRFRENAVEFSETVDDRTESGWEYDEYTLEIYDSGMAEADVEANYATWLEMAKAAEIDRARPPVRDEVLTLQAEALAADETAVELYETCEALAAENLDQAEALVELYEMVEGGTT